MGKSKGDRFEQKLRSICTLAGAFGMFREVVVRPSAPGVAVDEYRKAFYAGADWVMKRLLDAAGDEANEADGLKLLQGLLEETEAYGRKQAASIVADLKRTGPGKTPTQ